MDWYCKLRPPAPLITLVKYTAFVPVTATLVRFTFLLNAIVPANVELMSLLPPNVTVLP